MVKSTPTLLFPQRQAFHCLMLLHAAAAYSSSTPHSHRRVHLTDITPTSAQSPNSTQQALPFLGSPQSQPWLLTLPPLSAAPAPAAPAPTPTPIPPHPNTSTSATAPCASGAPARPSWRGRALRALASPFLDHSRRCASAEWRQGRFVPSVAGA